MDKYADTHGILMKSDKYKLVTDFADEFMNEVEELIRCNPIKQGPDYDLYTNWVGGPRPGLHARVSFRSGMIFIWLYKVCRGYREESIGDYEFGYDDPNCTPEMVAKLLGYEGE